MTSKPGKPTLFAFKETATPARLRAIEQAFAAMPAEIAPAYQAFVAGIQPHVANVLVIDYWARRR